MNKEKLKEAYTASRRLFALAKKQREGGLSMSDLAKVIDFLQSDALKIVAAQPYTADPGEEDFTGYIWDTEVGITFDYQPEEDATRTYPGCDAAVTVTGVFLRGVDILDLLDAGEVSVIEDQCWDNTHLKKADKATALGL